MSHSESGLFPPPQGRARVAGQQEARNFGGKRRLSSTLRRSDRLKRLHAFPHVDSRDEQDRVAVETGSMGEGLGDGVLRP